MRKLNLLVALVLICLAAHSQNTGWMLSGNYLDFLPNNSFGVPFLPQPTYLCDDGVTLNQSNTVLDGYDGQLPDFTSNMIVDPQGEIEFFIVDGVVYDGEGHYIDELRINGGPVAKGASETVIVPDPANCNRYYIVTARVDQLDYNKLPYVFLLDMELPNQTVCTECDHYGALVPLSCPGSGSSDFALPVACVEPGIIPGGMFENGTKNANCFLAASSLQAGDFHFVFISNEEGIFRFRIDASGFSSDNYFIPFSSHVDNAYVSRSEMELVNLSGGGFRLACPFRPLPSAQNNNAREALMVVDLFANGNIASTPIEFPFYDYNVGGIDFTASLKGVEFSEHGDRIYVTHTTNAIQPHQMEYYDFGTSPQALQPFSIPGNISATNSALELAGGDTLILANGNGLYRLPNATSNTPGNMVPMWSFSHSPTQEGISPIDPQFTMYMLPDQIDGWDLNQSFNSTVECCISNAVYEADFYVASSGTWEPNTVLNGGANPLQPAVSPDIYIQNELRIPAGATVTINNMNLHFAPGARLVIENGNKYVQGGRLYLNGTRLTVDDRCNEDAMWLGVEVWGNSTKEQGILSQSRQGRLFVYPGSRIEHAVIGVLVGRRNTTETANGNCPPILSFGQYDFDYTGTGGIVQTYKSSFFSNQRGIYFLPYLAASGANNLSKISETEFYWDGPLRGNYSLKEHVYFRQVKGIFVRGSSFRNDSPSQFDPYQLGTGIFSYGAQFYVQPACSVLVDECEPCPGAIRSDFTNLRFGVRTYNFENFTYIVKRSDFENCQYGVYSHLTNREQITENVFDVRQANYQTAGIALYSSSGFTVEENDIRGIGAANGSLSYGMVVNNAGSEENEVYLNNFKDLRIGGQSEGNNAVEITSGNFPGSSPFNMSGLNWICNYFEEDMEVSNLTVVNGRIDYFQGHALGFNSTDEARGASARNRFSRHGEPLADEHDIRVSGASPQELQYVGLNTAHYFVDSYTPNWVLPLIASYNGVPVEASPDMCPSRCVGDKGEAYQGRTLLQLEIADLEGQLSDPRMSASRRAEVEARIQRLKGDLARIEQRLLTIALLSYDELSPDFQDELANLNAGDLYAALQAQFAQDLSNQNGEPTVDEPAEFMPLTQGGSSRKSMWPAQVSSIEFEAYPNPANRFLQLNFGVDSPELVKIELLDLMGRVQLRQEVQTSVQPSLDISRMVPGTYLLQVKEGTHQLGTTTIVIAH